MKRKNSVKRAIEKKTSQAFANDNNKHNLRRTFGVNDMPELPTISCDSSKSCYYRRNRIGHA